MIIGRLIPAGTGFKKNKNLTVRKINEIIENNEVEQNMEEKENKTIGV